MSTILHLHLRRIPEPNLDQLARDNDGADYRDDEFDARMFRPHVTAALFLAAIGFSAVLLWIAVRGAA